MNEILGCIQWLRLVASIAVTSDEKWQEISKSEKSEGISFLRLLRVLSRLISKTLRASESFRSLLECLGRKRDSYAGRLKLPLLKGP